MLITTDLALKMLGANNNKIAEGGSGSRMNEIIKNLFQFKKLKNIRSENPTHIGDIKELAFLTPGTKKVSN